MRAIISHQLLLWVAFSLDSCICQEKRAPDDNISNHHAQQNNSFDFLMFTQLWPITSCLTWEDRGLNYTCTIDDSAKQWTIHGIWPTSNGKIGPLYCNKTDTFDPEKIGSLLPELRSKWTDVRANDGDEFDFWRHEWEKHGTCAEQLPSMANEYMYFKKALDLHSQYDVTALLSNASIVPANRVYNRIVLEELSDALYAQDGIFGIFPAINCASNKHFEDKLFYEIIICFDKEFKRIDCGKTKGGYFGSCGENYNSSFIYPDSIHYNNGAGVMDSPFGTVKFMLLVSILNLFTRKNH